jgi:membrane-anchored glycerophosphoryl diester phosphodiesterase (GDPDase)
MSDESLKESKNLFFRVFVYLPNILKILGAVLIFFAVAFWIFDILMKKRTDDRVVALGNIKYIMLGSFMIGMILEITAFLTASF